MSELSHQEGISKTVYEDTIDPVLKIQAIKKD